jgi:hypothetical protein
MPPPGMSGGVGGSSLLRERLQNFLPQIKKANEVTAEQLGAATGAEVAGSARIDEDLFVLADDGSDSDSDSDEDIGLTEVGAANKAATSKAKASKMKDGAPAVEIKLSFGEVSDEVLTALGEKVDGADAGTCGQSSASTVSQRAGTAFATPDIILPGVSGTSQGGGVGLNAVSSRRVSHPAQSTAADKTQ